MGRREGGGGEEARANVCVKISGAVSVRRRPGQLGPSRDAQSAEPGSGRGAGGLPSFPSDAPRASGAATCPAGWGALGGSVCDRRPAGGLGRHLPSPRGGGQEATMPFSGKKPNPLTFAVAKLGVSFVDRKEVW